MSAIHYRTSDILYQLDEFTQRTYGMPFFDGGQSYPIEERMTLYRTMEYWGIVLEHLLFSPEARGHQGIIANVFSYGNGLRVKIGGMNGYNLMFTADDPEAPTFIFGEYPWWDPAPGNDPVWEYVNPKARTMRIRDQIVPIETNPKAYEEMGIHLLDPPHIKGHELLRGLPLKYRKMLLAKDDNERMKKFLKAARPPMILQLDEWYHPQLSLGELPSQTETFRMLAEVLVTGDVSRYAPTKLPNTHWSNWPKAGMFCRPKDD